MSFEAISIEYDPETRTATADVDGEAFVFRAPDDYDYEADRGRWLVAEVTRILNERQLHAR